MAVIVVNHVSLDGVMQAPGRADEDTRGGFTHGGWAASADDPKMGEAMGVAMGGQFAWLFGHRTYNDLLGHWNEVGGPFKDGLNNVPKYVATSDPTTELPWPNSSVVSGDVPAAVTALRAEVDGNVVIMGSGELVQSLLPHGLVDEMLLMIHPVTLGRGRKLFPLDDALRHFALESAETTDDGILLVKYRGK
ncbi:dihydrofolate reductase family protein [Microbacterium sp. P03]|uniref:dihydrofolate reductase family protein n=1 Tax=Microbacterium sp. P03 TaxID=3366946 RepID=UPI0037476E59